MEECLHAAAGVAVAGLFLFPPAAYHNTGREALWLLLVLGELKRDSSTSPLIGTLFLFFIINGSWCFFSSFL